MMIVKISLLILYLIGVGLLVHGICKADYQNIGDELPNIHDTHFD